MCRTRLYFADMSLAPSPVTDIENARILGLFLNSITTDHISPAGNIKKDGPAGHYLTEHGVGRTTSIRTARGAAITR